MAFPAYGPRESTPVANHAIRRFEERAARSYTQAEIGGYCHLDLGEEATVDTPIAEEGFTGAAIGAAMLGLRPVVEIMTINFSLLALDQIVNHAAKIYGMARPAPPSSSVPLRARYEGRRSVQPGPGRVPARGSAPTHGFRDASRLGRRRSAQTLRH
ncbi:hypothetical protein [Agrococcus sp. TSP3-2-1]|uniref:hypothetical protein n=1 Tax=Agrococcus sp. TSP3-2-1 TaxID=2804583 RepID=UPI003CF8CC04